MSTEDGASTKRHKAHAMLGQLREGNGVDGEESGGTEGWEEVRAEELSWVAWQSFPGRTPPFVTVCLLMGCYLRRGKCRRRWSHFLGEGLRALVTARHSGCTVNTMKPNYSGFDGAALSSVFRAGMGADPGEYGHSRPRPIHPETPQLRPLGDSTHGAQAGAWRPLSAV